MMSFILDEKSRSLQELTKSKVVKILEIWTRTFGNEICLEMDKLYEHCNRFFDEVIQESLEKESEIKIEIAGLTTAAGHLIEMLNIPEMVPLTDEKTPLIVVKTDLEKLLAELKEHKRLRKQYIAGLLLEQKELCEDLGVQLRSLSIEPLATEDEIKIFVQHLDELKLTRLDRLKKIEQLHNEIKRFQTLLELPTEEIEDKVSFHTKLDIENIENLQKIHQSYSRQVKHKEIYNLYAERESFCNRMIELNVKSSEPGRYNNRGGQLLKEAKNRRMIAAALTKINQQLTQLVTQYEQDEGTHFELNGENIRDIMTKECPLKNKNVFKHELSTTEVSASNSPKSRIQKNCVQLPGNKKRNLSCSESPSPKLFLKSTNTATRRGQSKSPLVAEKKSPAKKLRNNKDNINVNSSNQTSNSYFGSVVAGSKTSSRAGLKVSKLERSNSFCQSKRIRLD